MRNIMWAKYGIYKNGKNPDDRSVAFYYNKYNQEERERKLNELLKEYPESEGYTLVHIEDYTDDDLIIR